MIILDFERPIFELEGQINELKRLNSGDLNIAEEVIRLERKLEKLLKQTYSDLTPWQKVQVARHSNRPQTLDYLLKIMDDFIPLCGDRLFAEDKAIIGGIGSFVNRSVVIIGHQRGRDTEERIQRNFGMPHPEGYRKAKRLMELADRFNLPIITFIDTAGAYPGVGAEERGQAEAIAKCIEQSLKTEVPIISIVIGEGGSGGAIALGVANTVLMLEHSVYSVISPEGCASILWKSVSYAPEAAEALRLTAQDLLKFKIIDQVIPEPLGGAHRNPDEIIKSVKEVLARTLNEITSTNQDYVKLREEKFMNIGRL